MRALIAIAMLSTVARAESTKAPKPTVRWFDSAGAALDVAAAGAPRVIAFGEYHEVEGGKRATSALTHFRGELIDRLPGTSDLIVETWVTEGDCGKKEEKVVSEVKETTKRPETTEDEIVTLLKHVKAKNIDPHILKMTCKRYSSLLDEKGQVDYVKLLSTVTELLREQILALHKTREHDKTIVVYGGALHNDVYPRRELKDFSFAKSIQRATKGSYREIDLYVPEFIESDKDITAEPWYADFAAGQKAQPTKTALVERSPDSFIVVFARAH